MKVYILEIFGDDGVVARKEVKTMTGAEARRRGEIFLKEYNGQNRTKYSEVRVTDARSRRAELPSDF